MIFARLSMLCVDAMVTYMQLWKLF
jgi:hypothetical protein